MNEYIKEQKMISDNGEEIHIPCYLTGFMIDIYKMNEMYRMPPVGNTPEAASERLKQFKSILEEECKEIDDVQVPDKLGTLTSLADLLGDIIVYCASEARRWDIPIDRVLNIIMQSNFSKLSADGKPIYDERMKLQKGPNYWKPEPAIEKMLVERNANIGESHD